jgi:hypothetical protein
MNVERSYLRTREAYFRKHPLSDAHVRCYFDSTTAWERKIWECPRCGSEMKHMDRKRDTTGHMAKHCGCRTGLDGRRDPRTRKYGIDITTPEGKKEARIRALPGYKPIRHDSHVHAYEAFARKTQAQKDWAAKQDLKLHDAHVKEIKKSKRWVAYRERVKSLDTGYRLNVRLRVQIRKALKGEKAGRKWETLLGYTVHDLIEHFRRSLPKRVTFEQAMAKGWHIDHIVPKSTYNLADERELAKAWCMSNLRLIPAFENLSKNDKRTHLC